MPRKKRKSGSSVPSDAIWCFYCDRTFKDESTLVTHQKAKHYRCSACNKKMNTAQGLQVHCEQVHKIKLTGVPGAKEGRENMQIEIFGMAGIPSDVYQGAPPELFRKTTKRQVMLGAALVDEKGNLRPSMPTNTVPLMPSLIAPPITTPPQPHFQPGSVPLGGPAPSVQPLSFGGLVSANQGSSIQSSAPLLFPQGTYNGNSVSNPTQSTTAVTPSSSAAQTNKTAQPSTILPNSAPAFIFPQSGMSSGTNLVPAAPKSRFIWRNEELSMEEVRASLDKYASLNS